MSVRGRRAIGLAAACAAAGCLAGAPAPVQAGTPKPKVVTVADFYFGPSSVKIRKGGKVKWVWASTNVEPHDVHLKSGPKKLKKRGTYSTKTTAVTNAKFVHAFPTPGTYRFICTIHPTKMKMTVTVKK